VLVIVKRLVEQVTSQQKEGNCIDEQNANFRKTVQFFFDDFVDKKCGVKNDKIDNQENDIGRKSCSEVFCVEKGEDENEPAEFKCELVNQLPIQLEGKKQEPDIDDRQVSV
jgi:hypothetical protein